MYNLLSIITVQVLIINFYEDSNNVNTSFIKFKTIIEKIVTDRCDGRIAGQCNFICKRQDELADFILDWEHDYLDERLCPRWTWK